MRSRLLSINAMLLVSLAALFGQWQPVGPPGGDFRALAMAKANDNIQYLAASGSYGMIWKTTDAGNNWNPAGAVGTTVYALAVDPVNANIVYAGGYSNIFRSTNGGVSWTPQTLPATTRYAQGLAVHPTSSATIMASCYYYANSFYHAGFLKSTNSGANWTSVSLAADTSYGLGLAVDPTNPDNIYVCGYYRNAGASIPAVYKSTDGGSTFAATGAVSTGSYCRSVVVHQTNSDYLYAGTDDAIFRSTDRGTSWATAASVSYNYSLATTPANANLLYSGGYGVIYRSTDAGATWTSQGTGLHGGYFYGLAAARSNANAVYGANNTGFYRSTNTGGGWACAHNGLLSAPVTVMANAPSAPGTIYVDNEGASMYRSMNNGAAWIQLTKPLSCGSVCAFAIYQNDPNTVLALEGSG